MWFIPLISISTVTVIHTTQPETKNGENATKQLFASELKGCSANSGTHLYPQSTALTEIEVAGVKLKEKST